MNENETAAETPIETAQPETPAEFPSACGGGKCFDDAHRAEAEAALEKLLTAARESYTRLSEISGCEPLGYVRSALAHIIGTLERSKANL